MKIIKLFVIVIFGIINSKPANSQDKLTFRSGRELSVFIQKETANEIYFVKTIEDKNNFMIEKAELKQINYANGDSTVFPMQNIVPADSITNETAGLQVDSDAIYKCWIYSDSTIPYKVRKGYIKNVADSGIYITVSSKENTFIIDSIQLIYLSASTIEKIKIRRKGNVGRGILIGAGVGFFIGGVLGAAGIPDYGILETLPPSQNALAGGIIFSIPGMIIGGIAGSFRTKIPLYKKQLKFDKHKKQITGYSTFNLK